MVIGYLIYTGLQGYHDFLLNGFRSVGKTGAGSDGNPEGRMVTAGSVQWDPKTLKLSFQIRRPTGQSNRQLLWRCAGFL